MTTVRADSFRAYRENDCAYFTVSFLFKGKRYEKREIYSGSPRFNAPVYCIAGEHVTVLYPWAAEPEPQPKHLPEFGYFGPPAKILVAQPEPEEEGHLAD